MFFIENFNNKLQEIVLSAYIYKVAVFNFTMPSVSAFNTVLHCSSVVSVVQYFM